MCTRAPSITFKKEISQNANTQANSRTISTQAQLKDNNTPAQLKDGNQCIHLETSIVNYLLTPFLTLSTTTQSSICEKSLKNPHRLQKSPKKIEQVSKTQSTRQPYMKLKLLRFWDNFRNSQRPKYKDLHAQRPMKNPSLSNKLTGSIS